MSFFDDAWNTIDGVFTDVWDSANEAFDASLDYVTDGFALQAQLQHAQLANQTAVANTGQQQAYPTSVISPGATSGISTNSLMMYGLIAVGVLLTGIVVVKAIK